MWTTDFTHVNTACTYYVSEVIASEVLPEKYVPLPHDLDGVHPGTALKERRHVAAVA